MACQNNPEFIYRDINNVPSPRGQRETTLGTTQHRLYPARVWRKAQGTGLHPAENKEATSSGLGSGPKYFTL